MNLRVGLLSGLLLVSVFAIAAPPASAQFAGCGALTTTCQTTVELLVTPPTAPIKPLGPFQALPITIRYTYFNTATITFASSQVDLSITNAPPWAVTTVSPTSVFVPVAQTTADGSQRVATAQAFLLVSTTADAPAFTQGNIEVTATARPNGALLGNQGRNSIPVQADFFSILEAATPTTIQKAKPQAQVIYPITVTNFGNQLTKVTFDVQNAPERWQVTPPSPITLESKQTGGQQNIKTANVVIQTPFQNGYLNVVGAITVRLTSNYALDPKVIGDSTIVSTLTTTKGFYVPGFEPFLALAGVGAVALLLGRRRPEFPE